MLRRPLRTRPIWLRLLTLALTVGQVLGAIPIAYAKETSRKDTAAVTAQVPTPEASQVEIKHTAPAAVALPSAPQFSSPPKDSELGRVHVFEEPLIPIGRATTTTENTVLAIAITTYIKAGGGEDLSPFEKFLVANPETPWRAALLTGLGIVYRRTGYFSKALAAWQGAWTSAKVATSATGNAIADRAVAELAELSARLGRYEDLQALFAEIGSREVHGSAAEKLSQAREGLAMMRGRPGLAFRCGPMALDRIMAYRNPNYRPDTRITAAESTLRGTSLLQVQELSQTVGLNLQMAFRTAGTPPVVPAVVHWKSGHFAALVAQRDGHYIIQDPTFGNELAVSQKALDEEGSGYALVAAGALPTGWRAVGADEGGEVWGKGFTSSNNPQYQTCQDPTSGGGSGGCPPNTTCLRMAQYRVHSMLVALNVFDQPVGYTPPRGGVVAFSPSYHQREVFQPQIPAFGNLGPKWTYEWLSFVEDDPANLSTVVNVYMRLGGQETSDNFDSSTQSYAPHTRSRAVVVRTSTSPIVYERRLPDGSKETFAQSDGSPSVPRKVYLSSWSDPQGNTVSLTYNGLKLVKLTDAIGQETTLSYDLPGDPLKITKVTDPFGRFATFEYNAQGQLQKITDVIGIASEFAYATDGFITSLTIPYGTTRFTTGTAWNGFPVRWVEVTDPLGGVERVEYRQGVPSISRTDPTNLVPTGMTTFNNYLDGRNTFFWDKRASSLDPKHVDYTKAVVTHWLHDVDTNVTAGIIESVKRPLENRVWYSYAGQTLGAYLGTLTTGPTAIGRVLDDGTTQLYKYEYNSRGLKAKEIDPLGRETDYFYGTNNVIDPDQTTGTGIDLLQVKQKNGGTYDVLGSYTYNAQHELLMETDAAGQATTYTYNTQGQLLTVETPARAGITENRTTTYSYDTNGYLQSVTGPATGSTISYTYDGFGRIRTFTDPEGYVLTYDYDSLDRNTKVTYPDGTYEQTVYNRLDAEGRRDRLGRWAHTFHDALQRVVAVRDPLGRATTYQWCTCGSLDRIVDGNGNATNWGRDLQGRVTSETRADGVQRVSITYESTTSRLKTRTDAKGQVTTYTYDKTNQIREIGYTNSTISTPTVSFTYDPIYWRVSSITDGTGTTNYSYYPVTVPSTLGAARLESIDGPLASDTVSYGYDELGRITTHGLAAFSMSSGHDALGRFTSLGSPVGTFAWTYLNATGQPQTVTYPNGQVTTYSYLDNAGDQRLQEIKHQTSGGSVLAQFDYTYDSFGNIKTWRQQLGTNPAKLYSFGYDAANQLTSAVQKDASTLQILNNYGYAFDAVGNRTVDARDTVASTATYNIRNELVQQAGGGALPVGGALSEAAAVTVNGTPAAVNSANQFTGTAQAGTGTQTFAVTATDPSGNTRTNTYQVDMSGAARTFTYDANGNVTSKTEGGLTTTYDWDAENRLVSVRQGTTTMASFVYDGRGRRVQKVVGGVTHIYVYDRQNIIEERLSSGQTYDFVHGPETDRVLAQRDQAGVVTYYLADHLGSIAQTTSSAGAVTLTREYDPWGNLLQGSGGGGYAYTGREWDSETGLYYYRARYYDPKIGRFLREDPIGHASGPNLYQYVSNDPVLLVDPSGRQSLVPPGHPSNVPVPKGCTAKPWRLLDKNTVDLRTFTRWFLHHEEEYVQGLLEGEGESAAASCACIYKGPRVFAESQTSYRWERLLDCCGISKTQTTTTRDRPFEHELPFIGPLHPTLTIMVPATANGCLCRGEIEVGL